MAINRFEGEGVQLQSTAAIAQQESPENRSPMMTTLPKSELAELSADLALAEKEQQKIDQGTNLAEAAARREILNDFKKRFSAVAADRKSFKAMFETSFGKNVSNHKLDDIRKQALADNWSWLPQPQFLQPQEMESALGAFDAVNQRVYLSRDLLTQPQLAAKVYAEETGHFLDTQLQRKDAPGDEGEIFQRALYGEKLRPQILGELRTQADHGELTIDGKTVQVEFFSIKKAFKSATKAVGRAVGSSFRSVATTTKATMRATANSIKQVGNGVTAFVKNTAQGKVSAGLKALGQGLDKGLLQAPAKMVAIGQQALKSQINAVTPLLGKKVGTVVNRYANRFVDATGQAVQGILGAGRALVRSAWDVSVAAGSQMISGTKQIIKGNVSGGIQAIAKIPERTLRKTFDAFVSASVLLGVSAVDSFAIALGDGSAPRSLTAEEKARFRAVYGDAVDLDLVRVRAGDTWLTNDGRAKAIGNTIYLPKSYFNAQGQLTAEGRETLAHELGHVWQYQNGGGDYIASALRAQRHDDSGAYDWQKRVEAGVAFDDLNAEAQAELIAYLSLNVDTLSSGNGTFDGPLDLYLRDALSSVRAGRGAP